MRQRATCLGGEWFQLLHGFEHGLLESRDFKLEGPLRTYARARIDTNPHPVDIRAVVGIFLFRAPNEILSSVPILRSILPGSDRGLIGAYFKVDGALKEPRIEALPLATLLTAVPSAIKTPMKVLQYLFNRDAPEKPPHPAHAHDARGRRLSPPPTTPTPTETPAAVPTPNTTPTTEPPSTPAQTTEPTTTTPAPPGADG